MAMPLLTTKLYIPPPLPNLVERPRLIERLNEGLHRKLTLISAPAGFGKTTLVSEWLSNLRVTNDKFRLGEQELGTRNSSFITGVAWLSFDEGDNDPVRFLAYFIAALQTTEENIGEGALGLLQSPQPPPTEAVLTSLINEIAALPDRLVLVLDDYHLIEAQPIHEALTFLLEHLPPPERGLHLVIATREDPDLPLARLRARGQLTELRAADLRFTLQEATTFFNRAMGLAFDFSGCVWGRLTTMCGQWLGNRYST
jgi:LuxR family maltose regulon positive regulatory protein